MEPLLFPCLFDINGRLLRVTKGEALKFWIKRHLQDDRFLLRYGASKRLELYFIIDRTGALRRVQRLSVRRSWAKPFATIHDFVLSECEIGPGERMTCAKLLEVLDGLKRDAHFPRAQALGDFLKRCELEQPFDATLFRHFLDSTGRKLPDSEWTEQYP